MAERAILFCVDRGPVYDEAQYLGPFATAADAKRAAARAWADLKGPDAGVPPWPIRRCRRMLPSEIARAQSHYEGVVESLDEGALAFGDPGRCWADWEDALIEPETPEAESAFWTWADTHLRCNVYVLLEGDP